MMDRSSRLPVKKYPEDRPEKSSGNRRLAWLTLEADGTWVVWVEHKGLAINLNRSNKAGEILRLMGDVFHIKIDLGGERRKLCEEKTISKY